MLLFRSILIGLGLLLIVRVGFTWMIFFKLYLIVITLILLGLSHIRKFMMLFFKWIVVKLMDQMVLGLYFQTYWNIIGPFVTQVVLDFFTLG